VNCICLAQDRIREHFCEHGNEAIDSVNGGEYVGYGISGLIAFPQLCAYKYEYTHN
jgi:hypothetical protein